jgi:hypothetical protein
MALSNAGCVVEAVCLPDHPVRKTRAVNQAHIYRGLMPLSSIVDAIKAAKPDFVIPCDDLAAQHLHALYQMKQSQNEAGAEICALIERSLGAGENYPILYARNAFIKLAEQEGIRVPNSDIIGTRDDLKKWIAATGFPAVLKADGTSGGDGVRIVRNHEEAERAFRNLQAPPLWARAAKRALLDRDKTLIWPSLLRRRSSVNAQAFVTGKEATSAVACWKGDVLASLHFEVVNKADSAGHATVVRLIDNPEMSQAADKMARRLNLSGLHGFDFMLESGTGNAYLIEINPRATQVGHLTFGAGRDLPAALYAAFSGHPLRPSPRITDKDTIALFPQEWIRDSESDFLQSAYHDVPWTEPELVRACIVSRRKQSRWYSHRQKFQNLTTARLPRS